MSFTDLVTIPELDKWIYHNSNGTKSGHSSVCDVLVTRIWKAGGVFGNLTDSFQVFYFFLLKLIYQNTFFSHFFRLLSLLTGMRMY